MNLAVKVYSFPVDSDSFRTSKTSRSVPINQLENLLTLVVVHNCTRLILFLTYVSYYSISNRHHSRTWSELLTVSDQPSRQRHSSLLTCDSSAFQKIADQVFCVVRKCVECECHANQAKVYVLWFAGQHFACTFGFRYIIFTCRMTLMKVSTISLHTMGYLGQTPQSDGHTSSQEAIITFQIPSRAQITSWSLCLISDTASIGGRDNILFYDPPSTEFYEQNNMTELLNLLSRMYVEILEKFGGKMIEGMFG